MSLQLSKSKLFNLKNLSLFGYTQFNNYGSREHFVAFVFNIKYIDQIIISEFQLKNILINKYLIIILGIHILSVLINFVSLINKHNIITQIFTS